MYYIIFKNNKPINSYKGIPYSLLGLSDTDTPTAQELAELDCYEMVDAAIPDHDPYLFAPIENWTVQGTKCIRSWTFIDQDQESSWKYLRTIRNDKIAECDWTQLSDSPLSAQQKSDWASYRQQLRDIPQTYEKAQDVVWPQPPQ
jgi:hypothetical protein